MNIGRQRSAMIERHLRARGIRDERVLAAMADVPREFFVPSRCSDCAYADEPLSIGYGQTISQPYITALMAEQLKLTGTEKVLEVGAGSGYHAAVLGVLAARVVTVELIPELAEMARANLESAGRASNILVVCSDGSEGYEPEAPYDAISVSAAAPEVPPRLIKQLADPGRMVIPVGTLDDQDLEVLTKAAGRLTRTYAGCCRFVPLRGGSGWRR